ncbi:uncharacterized protein BP5553_00295 [Venustampulla echinocandica]|uniref:Uncharacterized protein n=1 Tax=Venustampulla echinocandica TaxID=2656787 RepID=A0A370TXQ3_9HELO|nr:uncharacterized protein BP5553_00295 [Venustampulla echinocandica]RDL40316.1 hypothetical protein BP5553_00295 [Venustampulla echinocandica]
MASTAGANTDSNVNESVLELNLAHSLGNGFKASFVLQAKVGNVVNGNAEGGVALDLGNGSSFAFVLQPKLGGVTNGTADGGAAGDLGNGSSANFAVHGLVNNFANVAADGGAVGGLGTQHLSGSPIQTGDNDGESRVTKVLPWGGRDTDELRKTLRQLSLRPLPKSRSLNSIKLDPKYMDMDMDGIEELAVNLRNNPPLSLEEVREGRREDKRNRKIWVDLLRAKTIARLGMSLSEKDAGAKVEPTLPEEDDGSDDDLSLPELTAENQLDS